MKLSAIITKENNLFVAQCPELNIASQGDNENEAILNLKEAIELFLEDEDAKEVIKNIYPAKMCSIEVSA